jgi:hypothetical protein
MEHGAPGLHVGPEVALMPVDANIGDGILHVEVFAGFVQFEVNQAALTVAALAAKVLGVDALIALPYRLMTILEPVHGWPAAGVLLHSVSP